MRKDEFPIVYEYCRQKIVEELEKIKAEIEDIEEPDHDFEGFYHCQNEAFKIIDTHISELKGDNK